LVSYVDKSTFVDYPVVKIRSYNSPVFSLKKVLPYLYAVVLTSGIAFLVM
jgi:hypothetical protein